MKSFQCTEIARLHHELTLSPWRHRLHQIAGIIRTIAIVEPKREYPYSFVAFRVTGYRAKVSGEETLLSGKAIVEDLVDLADSLTAAHPLPIGAADACSVDADALAARFKVSSKTISRWRRRGLVGCWYRAADGPSQMLFTPRAVQSFVAQNLDLVKRGSSFKLMDDAERGRIVMRARELVASGQTSLHAVTLLLAEESGRAVETIRYTLRRFDFENPASALFDQTESANDVSESSVVYQAFMEGETARDLAARLNKSEGEICRLVASERVRHWASTPIEYIPSDEFDAADAEDAFLAPATEDGESGEAVRVPADLPPYLQELYRTPLLTADQERHLFRQMNYLLHRAEMVRREIESNEAAATTKDVDLLESWLSRATEVKNRLIQSNLRLVVSIAKRHVFGHAGANLFELVSDGNVALIRAVEKFDYSKGFRFSTYATWAITRGYARSVPEEITHVDRYRTGQEDWLDSVRDHRSIPFPVESEQTAIRSAVANCLSVLDERERSVVERHFGLSSDGEGRTLDEIGREFGISKERVRQIEIRALKKIRRSLGDSGAELLAG